MGEEFIDKRNSGSCRRRDKQRAALYEKDLFAGCPPEQITSVVGTTTLGSAVSPGDRLWADELAPSGPISFYSGDRPAVSVSGTGADFLRARYPGRCGRLVAEVRSRGATSGIVQIQARSTG